MPSQVFLSLANAVPFINTKSNKNTKHSIRTYVQRWVWTPNSWFLSCSLDIRSIHRLFQEQVLFSIPIYLGKFWFLLYGLKWKSALQNSKLQDDVLCESMRPITGKKNCKKGQKMWKVKIRDFLDIFLLCSCLPSVWQYIIIWLCHLRQWWHSVHLVQFLDFAQFQNTAFCALLLNCSLAPDNSSYSRR